MHRLPFSKHEQFPFAQTIYTNSLQTTTGGEGSKKSSERGQERSQDTSAESSKKRSQGSDETGEETSQQSNESGENLGEEVEDRVEDGGELRSKAGDEDDGLDGGEDFVKKDGDEGEDLVDVAGLGVKAGSAENLNKESRELEVDSLELSSGLGRTLRLGDLASLDLLGNVLDLVGAGLDVVDGGGQLDGELLDGGDRRSSTGDLLAGGLVDDLVNTDLLGNTLDVFDGVDARVTGSDTVLLAGDEWRSKSNGGEQAGEDERGLHDDGLVWYLCIC